MYIQKGQLKAIKSILPHVTTKDCNIIAEAGNDNGEIFNGDFLVKVGNRHYRFDNMVLVKTI